MSLSKDFMREQFMKHLKDNKQSIEVDNETKELFVKREYLGYFPTIDEAESLEHLKKNT